MACWVCGRSIVSGALLCEHCGAKQKPGSQAAPMVCTRCLTVSPPIEIHAANAGDGGLLVIAMLVGAAGFIVWPLFLLAGALAVLALWRMVASQVRAGAVEAYECPSCRERQMVPIDSPAGQHLIQGPGPSAST